MKSRRLDLFIAAIAGIGAAVFWAVEGSPGGLGFAAGAVAGYINYLLLQRAVARLGEADAPKQRSNSTLFVLRYGAIGLSLYAMMKYFEISLLAALAGLMVPVAATLAAILYELIFKST